MNTNYDDIFIDAIENGITTTNDNINQKTVVRKGDITFIFHYNHIFTNSPYYNTTTPKITSMFRKLYYSNYDNIGIINYIIQIHNMSNNLYNTNQNTIIISANAFNNSNTLVSRSLNYEIELKLEEQPNEIFIYFVDFDTNNTIICENIQLDSYDGQERTIEILTTIIKKIIDFKTTSSSQIIESITDIFRGMNLTDLQSI